MIGPVQICCFFLVLLPCLSVSKSDPSVRLRRDARRQEEETFTQRLLAPKRIMDALQSFDPFNLKPRGYTSEQLNRPLAPFLPAPPPVGCPPAPSPNPGPPTGSYGPPGYSPPDNYKPPGYQPPDYYNPPGYQPPPMDPSFYDAYYKPAYPHDPSMPDPYPYHHPHDPPQGSPPYAPPPSPDNTPYNRPAYYDHDSYNQRQQDRPRYDETVSSRPHPLYS